MKKYLVNIYASVGYAGEKDTGWDSFARAADIDILDKLNEDEDENTPKIIEAIQANTGFDYDDNYDDEFDAFRHGLSFVSCLIIDGEETDMTDEEAAEANKNGEHAAWDVTTDKFVKLNKRQVVEGKLISIANLKAWFERAAKSLEELEGIGEQILGEMKDEEV